MKRPRSAIAPLPILRRLFQANSGFISDNTNSNAATSAESLHTRQNWCAAKNPSRRCRTRFWMPHDTPPKEAAAHRVMRKRLQIRALWSRREKAIT
jgi:hypothetical protein